MSVIDIPPALAHDGARPLVEVRVGHDTLVAVHRTAYNPGYAYQVAVIATTLDGQYRSTLALIAGTGDWPQVPDPVLDAALTTARQLYAGPGVAA